MADKVTLETGAEGFPDVEKHNEEVARKLAGQGAEKPTSGSDLSSAGDALDKLVSEKIKKETVVELTDEEKAKAEADAKIATDKATADKAEADKVIAEREAALKKSEDYFKDSPALPANASPKSTEAFSHVKIKAAQEISSREAKIEELNKQLAEAQEKLKNPVPPEIEAELKGHREWRAKLDVDADPKFKEFDKMITSTQDFIYAQLKKSPKITDKVIEEIKKHGGPENVNMAKLFESIQDPTMQRIVESKVADIELTKFNREQAVKAAKENVSQYMTERQKASEQAATAHNTNTAKYLEKLHKESLPWLAEKPADPKADEAGKNAIEEHNKFVKETKENMAAALNEDSPEMRAIMIAGMAQLFKLQRETRAYAAVKTADDAKIAEQQKTITELTEKIDKFKKGSLSRPGETGAPLDGKLPVVKKDVDLAVPTSQALDDAAREVMEKRAAAGK